MFLYIATSAFYRQLCIVKLGMTEDLCGRRSTYQTSCPPGITPHSHDIDYDGVWETDAITRDDLFDYEDILHNQFIQYRMMRAIPGDTEWFNFKGNSPLDMVLSFMKTLSWVKREVPLSEITPLKRVSRHLRKVCYKNTHFIRSIDKRNHALNSIQEPIISSIQSFIQSGLLAGIIVAPCGSGKTRMTCKGMVGLKRVIVCCPSIQIQNQWVETLLSEGVFEIKNILTMGCHGTTNQEVIRDFMGQDTYCIITTYMSSNLLVDILTTNTQFLAHDEAHHLGGILGKEEDGQGKTRRLMMKASDLGVKRLSLTFTPRIVTNDYSDIEYASMDNATLFGSQIAELKLRDLIRRGVLPDYRLWTLRDSSKKGTGLLGKAEAILESWEATHVLRGIEEYILHHLIVFAYTNEEAKQLHDYFTKQTRDTLVLCVKGGDKLQEPIRRFSQAKRAILVNCKVLGEGVDIPIANAVAVTYPKHSKGEITQMILRAGRWYEGKSIFHILLPILDEDDMSGFEDVLTSLASFDDQIIAEIVLRFEKKPIQKNSSPSTCEVGSLSECIMIDEYEGSNMDDLRKCFDNIRKRLFPSHESKRIQELCILKGIDTSVEYSIALSEMPELPLDPKPKTSNWYDFLHPELIERIPVQTFVKEILESNQIRIAHKYDEWLEVQTTDIRTKLPTVQHINDGYFGEEYTNFNGLLETFGQKISRSRR
jgi:superfamily II DNA or RNA helicase